MNCYDFYRVLQGGVVPKVYIKNDHTIPLTVEWYSSKPGNELLDDVEAILAPGQTKGFSFNPQSTDRIIAVTILGHNCSKANIGFTGVFTTRQIQTTGVCV
jgi:hypothetical protein